MAGPLPADHGVLIGDLRYAMLPDRIDPLWAIRLEFERPHECAFEIFAHAKFGQGWPHPLDLENRCAWIGAGALAPTRRTLAAGCDHHLTKPVAIESLRALLRDADARACAAPTRGEHPVGQ